MSSETNKPSDNPLDVLGPKLVNLIRLSSTINAKDINFFNSIDSNIKESSDKINDSLVNSMNEIIQSTLSIAPDLSSNDLKLKSDFDDENVQIMSTVLDSLFENIEISLDKYNKAKNIKFKVQNSNNDNSDDGFTYLDENDAKKSQSLRPIPLNNNNMLKPQDQFLNPINNFETTPFRPLIATKPNSIIPFNDSMKLIESTDSIPKHYNNPYSYEIMNCEYPDWILNALPESESFESIPWNESEPAKWINDASQLEELLVELNKCKVIAIDLEHHDFRTYHGLTCLMQISTDTQKDYLIDVLSPTLRPNLVQLNEIFTNPSIIKVLHGAFMDIIWLQRDLGLYIVSLFDTYHASKQLLLGKYSLSFLLEKYVRFKTSKKWQLADWRTRPLSSEMMDYAKADTHFLIEIFFKMHKDLLRTKEGLKIALYESRKVSNRRFEYSTFKPKDSSMRNKNEVVSTNGSVPLLKEISDNLINLNYFDKDLPWTNLIFSNGVSLNQRPLLEILFRWRDNKAREEDESSRFIMSDFILISLVNEFSIGNEDFVTETNVLNCINKSSKFGSSFFIRKCIKELTNVIKDSLIELKEIDLTSLVMNESGDVSGSNNINGITSLEDEDIYKNVKDVNKLQKNFYQFYDVYKSMNFINSNKYVLGKKEEENEIFSLEHDTNGETKNVSKSDVEKRVSKVIEFFKDDISNDIEFEVGDEEEDIKAEEMEKQDSKYPAAEVQQPAKEDTNEIISLRKHHNNNKRKIKPEEDIFTLDLSKTIMETGNEDRQRKKQKKKRSFDPYARIDSANGEIPQLKKKKMVDRGKNLIFKKK